MINKVLSPLLYNGHFETFYSYYRGRALSFNFEKERITTHDNDFLNLYFKRQKSSKLVILTHGLEGLVESYYMKGMAQTFLDEGFDVLAWHMRGCGGELNSNEKFYHGGAFGDLHDVVTHASSSNQYESILLVGFSLGGSITLRYLGDEHLKRPTEISGGIAISTPCDLKASALTLERGFSKVYTNFFLGEMLKKFKEKEEILNMSYGVDYKKVKTIHTFNDLMAAPIHGFTGAEDYYKKCSSVHFLKNIEVPTLILNAANDPFLDGDCYPVGQVEKNSLIELDVPKFGGHLGFYDFASKSFYSEVRALEFTKSIYK